MPWPQPGPPRRASAAVIAAIAGAVTAVLVAAGAVGYVVINRGPSPTPTPTSPTTSGPAPSPTTAEAQQVKAINMVLTASAASLSNLQNLSDDVAACGNLSSDISQLKQIANERSQELTSAQELNVSAISGGATLKSQLVQALRVSLSADQDYVSWAMQQKDDGCAEGTTSQYFQDALALDSQAKADKDAFRSSWNPIAQKYGYQTDPTF
jgi:hypothetical protein